MKKFEDLLQYEINMAIENVDVLRRVCNALWESYGETSDEGYLTTHEQNLERLAFAQQRVTRLTDLAAHFKEEWDNIRMDNATVYMEMGTLAFSLN